MKKIEVIKRDLYEKIRAQVADRQGLQDREIRLSEKALSRYFSKGWKKTSNRILQKNLSTSDIVFWADFHGVRQFQKNLLRQLKLQSDQVRPAALALECLPSSSQKSVDRYLSSQISEQEFLNQVKWSRVWGFPWSHYKPLFDWARENKISLKVLNGPPGKKSSKERERWALKLIKELKKKHPLGPLFVLFGEHHLLPSGFPALMKKDKGYKILYVFQNADVLYFRKPPVRQTPEGQIFQLSNQVFCLQNVSPWVKWQSYKLLLDSTQDSELEDELDLTEQVSGLSQILSKTLELPFDPNHYAVFTNGDRALWDHLKRLKGPSDFFETLIAEGQSFVSSQAGWAYLGRISVNETASLAMQSLLFQFNPELNWNLDEDRLWNFLIWISAFSYFGSKIINPHRKTATLLELQKMARSHSGRPFERQAARLAVHYTLHHSLGQQDFVSQYNVSSSVWFQSAKWIAGLLGEKIFNAYNQGSLSLDHIKTFLRKNPKEKNFQIVMQNLYEAVERF